VKTSCRHLTREERHHIHGLLKSGTPIRSTACEPGRAPSTISREIERNSGLRGYSPGQARRLSDNRRSEAPSVPWKMDSARWRMVRKALKEGWSPEQTSGRFRREGVDMAGHRRIHRYVRDDRRAGGTLRRNLRRRGKKPNWRGGRPPAAASSPAGWTFPSGRPSSGRRCGSATGNRTRSSVPATAARS